MNKRKIIKIIGWAFLSLGIIFLCLLAYSYYWAYYKFTPMEEKFTHRVGYIDPDGSLLSEGFEPCGEYICDYYNGGPDRTTYSHGKNGLRVFIVQNYENRNYTDSGYLNIRFVVNCKGDAGRYIIHENDLNLKPYKFTKDLKTQLFDLTTQLKKWKPLVLREEAKDSYMYLSYRIENGNITQIIP